MYLGFGAELQKQNRTWIWIQVLYVFFKSISCSEINTFFLNGVKPFYMTISFVDKIGGGKK